MEVYHDTWCVGLAQPLLSHATTNNFVGEVEVVYVMATEIERCLSLLSKA